MTKPLDPKEKAARKSSREAKTIARQKAKEEAAQKELDKHRAKLLEAAAIPPGMPSFGTTRTAAWLKLHEAATKMAGRLHPKPETMQALACTLQDIETMPMVEAAAIAFGERGAKITPG